MHYPNGINHRWIHLCSTHSKWNRIFASIYFGTCQLYCQQTILAGKKGMHRAAHFTFANIRFSSIDRTNLSLTRTHRHFTPMIISTNQSIGYVEQVPSFKLLKNYASKYFPFELCSSVRPSVRRPLPFNGHILCVSPFIFIQRYRMSHTHFSSSDFTSIRLKRLLIGIVMK